MAFATYDLEAPARRRPSDRTMHVLCLGLSRSGTDSLRRALEILGYQDVYHGFVITAKQRSDTAFWAPLLDQKINRKPLGTINFDSVLGNAEAVTDTPAVILGEELMEYYPNARVVLNRRRDVDAWQRSMQATCLQVFGWPMWIMSWFDARLFGLWRIFHISYHGYYNNNFHRNCRSTHERHYRLMEANLRDRNRPWLDWAVEDGWEPLCQFLDKPIPDVPFPNGNKGGGGFEDNMQEATRDMVVNALRNMSICLAVTIAVVVAVYWKVQLWHRKII